MIKWILSVTSCVLLIATAVAQGASSQERPQWVNGFFQEETNSYIEVVSADGSDLESARNKAAQTIIERRSVATGQRAKVIIKDGAIQVSGSDELTVKARIIDEYWERYGNGQYHVSLLVQTAKNPTYEYERVKVTNQYGFSPRVFVPGMAQLHKGSTGKGIFFITAEVAMLGGVVISEGLRSSYESKINSTHNASERQNYINKADNMQNIRNGCIAGAVAMYAWNVIDGVVAKGKKHVVIGDASLHIAPYASPQSNGVMLSLNF